MRTAIWFRLLAGVGLLAAIFWTFSPSAAAPVNRGQLRKEMNEAFRQGNYKDAYEGFRKLALDPENSSRAVGDDLSTAVLCLENLDRAQEIDALLEDVVKVHRDDWWLLWHAAQNSMTIPHQGFIVAGEFHRGNHRGGGRMVNSVERDRIRALRWMVRAMPAAMKDENHPEVGDFFLALANILLNDRGSSDSWRLQRLSDLNVLPDYEDGWMYYRQTAGAPVDADGNPVFHRLPRSFEAAETDGQRWRWCLEQASEFNPRKRDEVRMQFAEFLLNQFGVQTMAESGWRFGRADTDDSLEEQGGVYALATLGEDETIARLASGIKRFRLPDEFNCIKIYQSIASNPKSEWSDESLEQLGQIFENRRQYSKAAACWRALVKGYPRESAQRRRNWQQRLDQITGNWGRFESNQTQPAGRGANIDYRFRNGRKVEFVAYEINLQTLLADVKTLLKSNPGQLDWQKTNIGNVGYRLVEENERQYLGPQVARWQMTLSPRPNHLDRRVTVAAPLTRPGAYLLRAKMAQGNTCFIVVWIDDTAIVKKPLEGKSYCFVADAVDGRPVAKANVEFFGWKQVYHEAPPRHEVVTREFAEYTDADGQIVFDAGSGSDNMQWLITARTPEGRFAYLGFSGVWLGRRRDAEYNATKAYTITDRPVYRPGQKAHYKFWVGRAKYDMANAAEFAGREFTVQIHSPKGEKIVSEAKKTDAYGGIEGEYAVPADAPLGIYGLQLVAFGSDLNRQRVLGGGSFRVEEYKKPEFEVAVDAPAQPVMLGEKIIATIKAKYYFGSPVTKAKVKYTVNRTAYEERWYPAGPWDWLYGPGYWWFGCDYSWYPGWRHWGCPRPMPFWWPRRWQPPELVADREVEIGPDGTVKVEIDTAVAKAIHPDEDHSYTIAAEVIDQSRRAIVGTGTVLAARQPFKVYAWLDRGYYRLGEAIHAHFSARTLDGKPVMGKGELRLLRITYKEGKPVETPVQTWPLDTNVEGAAQQRMTASQAGQYRLSYKLRGEGRGDRGEEIRERSEGQTGNSPLPLGKGPGVRAVGVGIDGGSPNRGDNAPHPSSVAIEGGYVFTIAGQGFDGSQFRFNHLELVPDKREYAPGDRVRLQINTDRAGGTVLLFIRPAGGVYLARKILRLDGKSALEEIAVAQKDMPNFFVEAVTIADGRVYSETKEIVVPPEKRVLDVAVQPVRPPSLSGRGGGGEGGAPKGETRKEKGEGRNSEGPHPSPPPDGEGTTEFRPGEKAKVKIKLTDLAGRPLVGSTVVAIYDKSLEYISGGSNVPDIKAFFWKWRRQHHPQGESSLDRSSGNLIPLKTTGMADLGVFGGSVAEELEKDKAMDGEGNMAFSEGRGRGGMVALGGMPRRQLEKAAATRSAGEHESAPPVNGGGGPAMVEPTIRTKFADTALWVGALATAADGTAEVSLDMPENLTTWRVKVWGLCAGTRVGEGFADIITRKNLIIRMEAPRFFVQTDEVVLSAVVHNYLKSKKSVKAALEMGGPLELAIITSQRLPDGSEARGIRQDIKPSIEIPPGGEARLDWRVKVLGEGQATIRMKALTDEESDAVEQNFPCYVHGMLKMDSFCGAIRPRQESGKFTITVPEKRQPAQSRLEVRFSPTLAGAMVDALPYLAAYPYGCTEQTLNRFLPTVITQKVLLDMKLDLKEIQRKRTNLGLVASGPWPVASAKQQAANPQSPIPNPSFRNPVFDQDEVGRMVKAGVERLTEMQCSDGGWGWFSGWGEHSSPHITAQVVHGLWLAKQNDVALVPGVLERGIEWLKRYQDEQVQLLYNARMNKETDRQKIDPDNLDAFVYMALVDAGEKNDAMLRFLYDGRAHLAVYGLAMYGLALEKQGEQEKLTMIMRNIGQYVEQDDENLSAWLHMPENCWWCWYGSEYEAEACYLKLLARTDPKGELAPRLVKYLLNNRKNAAYWNSTRDTALCVEALAEFIRRSGEDRPAISVEVYYDGKLQKAVEITPQNLFAFDNKFILEGDALTAGRHVIELKKQGAGPLYYNGYLTAFTLEDFIGRAGLEVKVDRRYYKLVKADKSIEAAGSRGQAVDEKIEKYQRRQLPNLAEVESGDLVEIELEIQSKNDYEYLVFEDMKPAGFEPVDLRSGYTGNDLGAYVEFRDNRVAFFVGQLARGRHSVSYRMRAETPGKFSALPTRAWAMYAPELKANSDELKLRVEDAAAP